MTSRAKWIVGVLCLLRSLAMFDVTAMNVALPSMVSDLGTSLEIAQWTIAGYSLALAAGVLSAGAIADRIGPRRMLVGGLSLLIAGALLGALVGVPVVVVLARVVMGAGAAAVLPGSLAVLSAEFAPQARGRVVPVMWAASTVVLVSGPVLGGLLVEAFGWSSVLLVNAPICVLASVACVVLLQDPQPVSRPRADVVGMALSAAGGASIVFGTISASRDGAPSIVALPTLILGAALFAAFVLWERRQPEPLLDIGLLRQPRVAAGAIEGFLAQFALSGVIFVLTLYLQFVLALSPVDAGIRALPMMATLLLLLPLGERLVRSFGDVRVLVLGLIVLAAGIAQLATVRDSSGYTGAVPGLLLMGAGMGIALPTSTVMLLNAVPTSTAGTAAGVTSTVQEFGNAIGVAALGGILAGATVGGGAHSSDSLGSVLSTKMDAAIRTSFFEGMSHAFATATGSLVLGGLLCWGVARWNSPAEAAGL